MQFRPLHDHVVVKRIGGSCLSDAFAHQADGVRLLGSRHSRASEKWIPYWYGTWGSKLAAMFGGSWTRESAIDLIKFVCAAILFGSPWVLKLSQVPAWNVWICGYVMLTASLAALVAEADWEPRANLWLGTWVLAAPWTLGFSHEAEATLVHVIGGALMSMLSAAEVWFIGRSPPWRFGPGAAQRAPLSSAMMTVCLHHTRAPAMRAVRRRRTPWGGRDLRLREAGPGIRGAKSQAPLRGVARTSARARCQHPLGNSRYAAGSGFRKWRFRGGKPAPQRVHEVQHLLA